MKKLLALVLSLVLILAAVPALAEYDKHISITASYVDRGSTAIDDMYHFFCDPYNIDIEMIGIPWSSFANTNSVMVMGQSMYDWMLIGWDYNTYVSYVDQGLIKPLPDNFEEKYPNIARAFEASGIGESLYVDGVAYGVPMPILFNFAPQSYYLKMQAGYYRVDWAEQLGFHWDAAVTLSEFEAYLKACIDNDMVGNGQTLGFTSSSAVEAFMNTFNDSYNSFVKVDGQYAWGPTLEGTVDGIKELKKAYADGLIDPDFFAVESFSAQNKFAAGLSAATYATGTCANYQLILDSAAAAGIENPVEKIKPIMIVDNEGVWHGGQVKNFWCINVFKPDLDEEAYERVLSLLDYLYTQEAEEVINMGIKGVDWDLDENGRYVSYLDPAEYANIRQKYASGWFWRDTAICLDEFDLINPTYDPAVLDNVNAVYDYRYASAEKNGYTPWDTNVQFLATEAKQNYSVDVGTEITRIMCDENIAMDDVEAEWQKFIDANAAIWQPVVDDLNALLQ